MRNKIIQVLLVSNLALFTHVKAQNIAINTTGGAANAAAILDLSNTGVSPSNSPLGLLIPSSTTSSLPGSLPANSNGLLFYNTTNSAFNVNTNSSAGVPIWATLGNIAMTTLLSTSGAILTSSVGGVTSNTLDLTLPLTAAATTVWDLSSGNSIPTAVPVPSSYGSPVTTGNFVGTTNANDLVLAAHSIERLRVANTSGNIGIGTGSPNSTLELNGTFGSSISSYSSTLSNIVTIGAATVYYINKTAVSTKIILPTVTACNCNNRRYVLVNNTGSNIYLYTTSALTTPSYILKRYSGLPANFLASPFSYEILADPILGWIQIH